MPFLDATDSLRVKVHATETHTPILIGVLVLAGIALIFALSNVFASAKGAVFELEVSSSHSGDVRAQNSSSSSSSCSEEEVEPACIYVFVSGAVASPGVFSLPEGSRVNDAIGAAGGFSEGAATDYNNLARTCVDGEQIHVPSLEEASQGATDTAPGISAPSAALPGTQNTSLININTATAQDLESLPGVGPTTAQKIVANREAEGPFSTPDEIMRVSGIGEKKYAAFADLICV